MGDFDRRPRRGGGRPYHNNHNNYNQNNNRKRRYQDDDFDDRRQQRRRYEEPLAVTLRKQILSLAESPMRRVEEDIVHIAKTLSDNYFDSDVTSGFLNLAVQMTTEQPLKIPFIASVVSLINVQKPEFATEILKTVGDALQKHLNAGEWRETKLYLRMLACLQGLFERDGIFTVLEELFSRAVELQTESSEDSLGLELVKIILLTIPYTMASSATGFEEHANSLLDKTEVIAAIPHAMESLVDPYPNLVTLDTTSSESALAQLQKQMQEEAKSGWQLACLPRPWKQAKKSEEEEDPLKSAQKHAFPPVAVPEKVTLGPTSIYPETYFSVYAEQDIETVPPPTNSASLLIRDALCDAMNVLHYNRSIAARFLIDIDCYFAPETFAKRGTAFDKLRELAGEGSTWKPEDVAVDAAFANLFSLPSTDQKAVFYHAVITEACKIAPAAVAPSLGRAIRYLYRNIDRMDLELINRFLDWFAHHLSNFGFTWKWTEWVDDVELPDIHPKKAFIAAALDKEIRLSFAQRIKGTLPEPYHPLISIEKEKDMPDFKYNDETVPFSAEARELVSLIRKKATDEEFDAALETIRTAAKEAAGTDFDPESAVTDAFVTSICFVGSKSLSHALNVIERYRTRLTAIAEPTSDSPDTAASNPNSGKKQIITSVLAYWADQPAIGINLVDKLVNYQVLSPTTVIEWCLVDHVNRGHALSLTWVWELVTQILDKVVGRVRHVVAAMRRPGLPEDQLEILKPALERELNEMRTLFELVDDKLHAIEGGFEDGMMETDNATDGAEGKAVDAEEETKWVRNWGGRWRRAVTRKLRTVETWVTEELARPIPIPPPQVETIKAAAAGQPAQGGAPEAMDGVVKAEDDVAHVNGDDKMHANGLGNGIVNGDSAKTEQDDVATALQHEAASLIA